MQVRKERQVSPGPRLAAAGMGLLACFAAAPVKAQTTKPADANMSYLDNGVIRIGVNLDLGGAITYLADSKKPVNVVNSFDWGRQIQMSFYSWPKPYTPGGKQPNKHWRMLGWNPIQSGDCFGNRSKVIDHHNDGKTLHLRCIPMQWPLDNEPGHCTFESWIELKGSTAHVRCRLNNARRDKTLYPARAQELPAVYTNGFLYRLLTYDGERPFTGAKLTQITKRWGPPQSPSAGNPWAVWQATESWAALLNDDDWGLGVWTPGTYSYHGGFYAEPGAGGPKDKPTGYIGPRHIEILDHDIRYEYGYVLILGSIEDIRRYVYENADRPDPPDYRFVADRQHWHYANCRDTGWPIRGELHVLLDEDQPRLIGPPSFWKATDAPRLTIRAAFRTKEDHAVIRWRCRGEKKFAAAKRLAFPVQPDGQYRTYEINLATSPDYRGIVRALRLDPAARGGEGQFVRIESISFRSPRPGKSRHGNVPRLSDNRSVRASLLQPGHTCVVGLPIIAPVHTRESRRPTLSRHAPVLSRPTSPF